MGIAWEDLVIQQADTSSDLVDSMGTGGSSSVASSYAPLRQAAAGMRSLLLREAASALEQPEDALRVDGRGFAVADNPEQRVDFHPLAAAISDWELPADDQMFLKSVDEFTVIGQSLPRIDIPDKVTGRAIYGYDMRLPNMLYGAVARPPTLEAKLRSASAGEAEQIEGVERFVIDVESGFAGSWPSRVARPGRR